MRKERLPRAPIDMCNGPILPQLLRFAVPMMLTGVLQLLYNTADLVVVGQFAGSTAIAAVGATSSLSSLLINLFIGLSVGANVVIAQALGAGDNKRASTTAHTALVISVLSGILVGAVTFVFAKQLLAMMGTPADVLPAAALYLRILACGFPLSLLYNFSAAILRACGNTRRPLYFLLIAGFVKVCLNLLFVAVFKMQVDGVALATVLSQILSAFLAVYSLLHFHGPCRLFWKRLKICRYDLVQILKIGIPASIQSVCFSLSNVLIQSSINTCGANAIAGNTAGYNLESFVFACVDAVSQACLTFVGQNMGAKKYRRIPRVIGTAVLIGVTVSVVMSGILIAFPQPLLSIYTSEPDVISYGKLRIYYLMTCYFLVPLLYTYSYSLRAIGRSALPMVLSIVGICGLRVVCVAAINAFEQLPTLETLYLSYPISWILTFTAVFIAFQVSYRRILRQAEADAALAKEALTA